MSAQKPIYRLGRNMIASIICLSTSLMTRISIALHQLSKDTFLTGHLESFTDFPTSRTIPMFRVQRDPVRIQHSSHDRVFRNALT